MLNPYDNYVFSVPVVFRSKAQCEVNGDFIGECWNVVAKHHRDALWVSLLMSRDWVTPLDKELTIACEARLALNIDKLTERAIIKRIEHT